MNREHAIARAKAFVLQHVGIDAEPASAQLLERPDERAYWSVVYMPDALHPKETAQGEVIDGPYVLHVDDVSGAVSVLG